MEKSLPNPKTLSDEELKNINFPVYVALSDKSAITGEAAKQSGKFFQMHLFEFDKVKMKIFKNQM